MKIDFRIFALACLFAFPLSSVLLLSQETKAELIKMLSGPDAKGREVASLRLGMLGAEAADAIPAIIQNIVDFNNQGNKEAPLSLSWIGEPALSYIKPLFKYEHPYVRAEAMRTLGLMGEKALSLRDDAIPLLNDENRYVIRYTIEFLTTLGPQAEPALPRLVELLGDYVNVSRAIPALVAIGPASIPALKEALQDPKRANAVLTVLSQLGEAASSTLEQIIPLLDQPRTARTAIRAIAAMGPKAEIVIPRLIELLADHALRNDAAEALGRMGAVAKTAVQSLLAVIVTESKDNRGNVINAVNSGVVSALGSIGDASVLPRLLEVYANGPWGSDRSSKIAVLNTISALKPPPETYALLVDGLGDSDARLVERLLHYIDKFPVDKAVPALEAQFNHKHAPTRYRCIAALLRIKKDHEQAAKLLNERLRTTDIKPQTQSAQRMEAFDALRMLTDESWQPDFKELLSSEDVQLKSMAAAALVHFPKTAMTHKSLLVELLNAPDPALRRAAAIPIVQLALDEAAIDKALKDLVEQARSQDGRQRTDALETMGKLKNAKTKLLPLVEKLAQTPDWRERGAAETAYWALKSAH